MNSMKIWLDKNYKILVTLFFVAYFCLGVSIFRDYGVSWDEHLSHKNGMVTLSYIVGNDYLLTYADRYHGVAFEMILALIGGILNPFNNLRTLYLIRHFLTFLLFFIGTIFFYKLCKRIFNSWRMGLLGSLFLILNPRIFAHSFYNSKDIPLLSVFIISVYTLVFFLDKKTIKSTFAHAITCAFLIDIRIVGVVVPFITFVLFIAEWLFIKKSKTEFIKAIKILLIYTLLLIAFVILFWPILWNNPLYHFINAFKKMSHYSWEGEVLYLSNYIDGHKIPWHYMPVWIAISTPLVYLAGFIIGIFVLMKKLFKRSVSYLDKRNELALIMWFSLPLLSVIFLHSVVYDEWRHLFFIYPAIIIISLMGFKGLFEHIKNKFQGIRYNAIASVLVILMLFDLSCVAYFMVKNHPFQNVYFNTLVGLRKENIKNNFELDYWGLSYRKALEYVLAHDQRNSIRIYVANSAGESNVNILPKKERSRILFVDNLDDADYFLSNYRCHKEEYPYKDEYYSITVGGLKIMVVYKLKA